MAEAEEAKTGSTEAAALPEEERSAFFRALDAMVPEDIPLSEEEKEKKEFVLPLFGIFRVLLILVCLLVLAICGEYLIGQYFTYRDSDKTYENAQKSFWEGLTDEGGRMLRPDAKPIALPDYRTSLSLTDLSEYTEIRRDRQSTQFARMRAKLNALKEANPDTFGYIYIEDTQVDYPVVRHDNNDYYLKHDYTGKYSGAGAIFVDCANRPTIMQNRNTVMYGHHMSSGSTMFHTLDNFFDETFFNEHPDIYVYTFDGIYRFRVFAVYVTKATSPYIKTWFKGDDAFVEFCEAMRANSEFYREGVEFDKDSHLLTLSTCTNVNPDDRITVQAVLVEVQN